MKFKLFTVQTGNRKPRFDALEAEVNTWLDSHPGIVIEHTDHLTQPNASWTHLAMAVWYTER